MSYVFEIIDIFAFDVHTAVPPLLNPNLVQPDFRFLVDPALYASAHAGKKSFQAGGLAVKPVSSDTKHPNYFWNYYSSIRHDLVNVDFWKLQTPFLCTPQSFDVTFATGSQVIRSKVQAVIYVNGLGWSSNVHIRLLGKMGPDDAIAQVGRARTTQSFGLRGSQLALSNLFGAISREFRKALYGPVDPLVDQLTADRRIIVSIAKYTGPQAGYLTDWSGVPQMPDADRALMHSIWLGNKMDSSDVIDRESAKSFLRTQFNAYDFALTYFDAGSFVFMQKSDKKRKRTTLWCLASNIRSCTLATVTLQKFLARTDGISEPKEPLKTLRDAIPFTLRELGSSYRNAFCKTLFMHHSQIQKSAGAKKDGTP